MATEPEKVDGEVTPSWMVDDKAAPAEEPIAQTAAPDVPPPEEQSLAAEETTIPPVVPPPVPSEETGPLNTEGMKILIVVLGNRGDVAPAAALGASCMCRGAKSVAIASHPTFKDLLPSELGFFSVGPSITEALQSSPDGKQVAEASSFSKTSAMKKFMNPYVDNVIDQIASAVSTFKPDSIVWFTTAVFLASPILDRFPTLASVWCHLLPYHPTTEHAPPVGFGDGHVYFSFGANLKWNYAMSGKFELYKPSVDTKRAAWGLSPNETSLYESPTRTLKIMAYNSSICPRPSDWDTEHVHVLGSFLQKTIEMPVEYKPPIELIAPLGLGRDASELRPAVFTFGSAISSLTQPEQKKLLSACVRAGCDLGVGAIIFTKGALSDEFGGRNHALLDDASRSLLLSDPKVVLFDGECPHNWLFSKAGAVVCHGGVGTIYTALASKCPVIVSPVSEDSDQAWWGGCIEKQGLGKLIQPATLHKSGKTLASSLRDVMGGGSNGQALKAKASAFSESVAGTDPAGEAARLVISETQSAAEASGKLKFALYPQEVVMNFSTASTSTAVPKHFKLKHDAAVYR